MSLAFAGVIKAPIISSLIPLIGTKLLPSGVSKEPACQCRRHEKTRVRSLGWEDPLEEGMATLSSFLAWRIPQTEEPGRL